MRSFSLKDIDLIELLAKAKAESQLIFDAVQAASNGASEGQITIGVGTRNAILHPRCVAVSDLTETQGAIIYTPTNACWSPRTGLETAITIDRWGP